VLLHRGEAHRVAVGQLRHGRLIGYAAAEDVAARAIGQCVKQPVHVVVGRRIYNHSVVG
jgi:hypothetical protein